MAHANRLKRSELEITRAVVSTTALAEAIGVSESSIKRWADSGLLRAARTAGGHRRIPLHEAIRFIRETRATLVRPQLLGLDDIARLGPDPATPGGETERLVGLLGSGSAAHVRGLFQALYLGGMSVAEIVDGPLREAMSDIGALWKHEPEGILAEHHATDLCIAALSHLRSMFPEPADGPLAAGGAPAGDPYILPSLAAATVLAAEGFRTVNLGANTPLATLERAASRLQPVLVWLSLTSTELGERTVAEIARFVEAVRPRGVSVVVGGRSLPPGALQPTPNLHIGRSMAELVAFARGLRSARPATRTGVVTAGAR